MGERVGEGRGSERMVSMLEKDFNNTLHIKGSFFFFPAKLVGTHLGSNATPPFRPHSTQPKRDGQCSFGLPVFTGVPHLFSFFRVFFFFFFFFFFFANLVPQKIL